MAHRSYNNTHTAPNRVGADAVNHQLPGKHMRGTSEPLEYSDPTGGLSQKTPDLFGFVVTDGKPRNISPSSLDATGPLYDKMFQSIAKPAKAKTRAPAAHTPQPSEQAFRKAVRFTETELRNNMRPSSERSRHGAGKVDIVSHRPSDANSTAASHFRNAFKQLKAGFDSLSKGDRHTSNESDKREGLPTNELVHCSPSRERACRQQSTAGGQSLIADRCLPTADFYHHRSFSGLVDPVRELGNSQMGKGDLGMHYQPELHHHANAQLRSKYSEEQPWPVSHFADPEIVSEEQLTTYAHNKLHAKHQQHLHELSWQQECLMQPEQVHSLRMQQAQRERHSLQRSQALWSGLDGAETWSRDEQPFVFPVSAKPQPTRYKRRQATQQTSTLPWQRAHLRTSGTGYVGARSHHCNRDSGSASYVPNNEDDHQQLLDPQAATYAYKFATVESLDDQSPPPTRLPSMMEARSSQIDDTAMANDTAEHDVSPLQSNADDDQRSEVSSLYTATRNLTLKDTSTNDAIPRLPAFDFAPTGESLSS